MDPLDQAAQLGQKLFNGRPGDFRNGGARTVRRGPDRVGPNPVDTVQQVRLARQLQPLSNKRPGTSLNPLKVRP